MPWAWRWWATASLSSVDTTVKLIWTLSNRTIPSLTNGTRFVFSLVVASRGFCWMKLCIFLLQVAALPSGRAGACIAVVKNPTNTLVTTTWLSTKRPTSLWKLLSFELLYQFLWSLFPIFSCSFKFSFSSTKIFTASRNFVAKRSKEGSQFGWINLVFFHSPAALIFPVESCTAFFFRWICVVRLRNTRKTRGHNRSYYFA